MSAAKFVNPYNFAPLPSSVPREPVEKTPGFKEIKKDFYTGWLEVEITTLTRLVMPSQRPEDIRNEGNHLIFNEFMYDRDSKSKIIPGTSLKGPVRAVMEALSDSCLSIWNMKYEKKEKNKKKVTIFDYSDKLDKKFKSETCRFQNPQGRPVTEPGEGLCVCCRLFGATGKGVTKAEDDQTSAYNALQGRVVFGDAFLVEEDEGKICSTSLTLKELSSPKPWHDTFYLQNGKRLIRGRKFYVHQEEKETNYTEKVKTKRNRTVAQSILPGARFRGRVYFTNLTPGELGLLLWGLELDDKEVTINEKGQPEIPEDLLAHKIGMGKPLGLGSVKIRVTQMAFFSDPAARYQNFSWDNTQASVLTPIEEINLKEKKQKIKAKWAKDAFQGKDELKLLLKFKAFAGKTVRYPSYSWFDKCDKVLLPPPGGELEDPCTGGKTSGGSSTTKSSGPAVPSGPFEEVVRVEEVTPQGALVKIKEHSLLVKLPPYLRVGSGRRIKVKVTPKADGSWKAQFKSLVKD